MKLNWPSKLNFKFLCNGEIVSGLIVYITLLSKLKNNFTIGPLVTNGCGEIQLTHEEIINFIDNVKTDYPMDYSGELKDCSGIEVIIDHIDELKNRTNRLREFYPKNANILEALIMSCTNSKYRGVQKTYKLSDITDLLEIILEAN